jgi:hypothetical protein
MNPEARSIETPTKPDVPPPGIAEIRDNCSSDTLSAS